MTSWWHREIAPDLKLGVRARNSLGALNAKSWDDVTVNGLLKIRNCGRRTVKEIIERVLEIDPAIGARLLAERAERFGGPLADGSEESGRPYAHRDRMWLEEQVRLLTESNRHLLADNERLRTRLLACDCEVDDE